MSDAIDVVRRLEEAWASWDGDTVRELLSPDLVQHTEHTGGGHPIDALIQANEGVRMAMPDVQRTIEDIFEEGDKVALRIRMQGTNTGGFPWFGIPANGKSVDTDWISIYRVQDGKVVEHWAQMDVPKMMMQLGAMPAPGDEM